MKVINHESYVSFEVAKLLKKLGFDWDTYNAYNKDGVFADKNRNLITWNHFSDYYSAPTLEVAQRWLREVKNIEIQIKYLYKGNPLDGILEYRWAICFTHPFPYKEFEANLNECQPTYEEAQEVGIKKALELILEGGE